jgi:hypothetical protein
MLEWFFELPARRKNTGKHLGSPLRSEQDPVKGCIDAKNN